MYTKNEFIVKYLASIVIPTLFSNLGYLRDCLESLKSLRFDQSITVKKAEILIICNTTQEEMEKVKQKLKFVFNSANSDLVFKWLCMGYNAGFVKATNVGIKKSLGKYVVFLNDDTQVDPLWLSELILTQKKTQADMVASKVFLDDRQTIDSQGFGFAWRGKAEALDKNLTCSLSNDKDYWLYHQRYLINTQMNDPFGPDGVAALYTRKLFNEVGLLEDDFFCYLEDVDLAIRARQHGMFCTLAEKAIIYHHKHTTSAEFHSLKSKQDLINWWRIVTRRYEIKIWLKFWLKIIEERARNLSGFMKSLKNSYI